MRPSMPQAMGTRRNARGARAAAVAVVLLVAVAIAPAPAGADSGVGIMASPITSANPLRPGSSQAMGPVTVVNTGSAPATVEVWVDAGSHGEDRPVPVSWVAVADRSVELAPREQAAVPLTVSVPPDAAPGRYRSLLYAGLAVADAAAVNQVGARAATWLEFTVDPSPAPDGGSGPRPVLVVLGLAVLVGGVSVARRPRRPAHP